MKAILSGRLVPVLGLDGAADLAAAARVRLRIPDERPLDLARVSQYVATMNGSGPLYDELHTRFEAAIEPSPSIGSSRDSRRSSGSTERCTR